MHFVSSALWTQIPCNSFFKILHLASGNFETHGHLRPPRMSTKTVQVGESGSEKTSDLGHGYKRTCQIWHPSTWLPHRPV